MNAQVQRTPQEISELKSSWKSDPNWDIENTEGFEAHIDELMAFRLQCEAEWRAAREASQKREEQELRDELASLGDIGLLKLVKSLKMQLTDAEDRIYRLENPGL